MTASRLAASILQNEGIYFGLFAIAVILLLCFFGYVLREWSWVPRRRQRRSFNERW